MENSQQELNTDQNQITKKAGGHSKKSSKPTGNPMGGRSRAKSTVLANFEKNLKANSTNTNENKKIITGLDSERFNNLRAMFDKKPEERPQEENDQNSKGRKIEPNKLKSFISDNANQTEKKNSILESNIPLPSMSIQERISMLMKSQDENKSEKKNIDPIIEKLRQTNLDDDLEENSGEDYSDDNLDISKGEENHENDDLGKSEGLSEEIDKNENEKFNENTNNNQVNKDNKNSNQSKNDLDKSESLDDDI